MESELFGHIKGSFSGATKDKIGLFQAAAGGTLFLDEVADLPLAMQVKLLRAIQEKMVRPVGANEEQPTDIRLLSATHKNLADEVAAGNFRNDLYYRINVIDVSVPSLRERREDLQALTTSILARIASAGGNESMQLETAAMEALHNYSFPGNVRELENILERALALAEGDEITVEDLQFSVVARNTPATPYNNDEAQTASRHSEKARGDLEGYLEDIEREVLSKALEDERWNKFSQFAISLEETWTRRLVKTRQKLFNEDIKRYTFIVFYFNEDCNQCPVQKARQV